MTTIRGFSHGEVWLKAVREVVASGRRTSPRGMDTFELPWMQLEVYDPTTFPLTIKGREFKHVIGVLEGLQLVGEFSVPELLNRRVKKFAQFEDNGIMWGAYGARTHGQLGGVVELLKRDPDSRQAVMTFLDAGRDLDRDKHDIPCTISAQFILREGRLDLGISMRSNDLWLGTPYDFEQFSILQCAVAQSLAVGVGRYVHRVGSLHLYAHDYDKVAALEWKGAEAMKLPLFAHDDVQQRARDLALGDMTIILSPKTPFETWADGLIRE